MPEYQTSLLREKFVITAATTEIIALSNRIHCPLHAKDGTLAEDLVIRGRNMYDCIRMVAKLTQAYNVGGSLIKRHKPLQWNKVWEGANSEYDKTYKPNNWIVVYHEGQVIFESGERHPFLDIIESFAFKKYDAPYEEILLLAKQAFESSGKDISIDHDANVAFLINADDSSIRCGTTHRTANNKFTMSFSANANTEQGNTNFNKSQFISAAAAHTEALQLTFTIGRLSHMFEQDKIEKNSSEEKQLHGARIRLNTLQSEIENLENSYKIRYRPEKPDFKTIIDDIKATLDTEAA